jgi:hypothetical protein
MEWDTCVNSGTTKTRAEKDHYAKVNITANKLFTWNFSLNMQVFLPENRYFCSTALHAEREQLE